MDVQTLARNIQIILAPVVMVTACAILVQGLLGRYAALNERLRVMAAERLKFLYASTPGDRLRAERLNQIDAEIPLLLAHHKRSHDAVLSVYAAALVFIVDMFVIALAAMYQLGWLTDVALLFFLAGITILMLGLFMASLEVRTSHQALHYEIMRVVALPVDEADTTVDKGTEGELNLRTDAAGL